jgi:hypothetical protein
MGNLFNRQGMGRKRKKRITLELTRDGKERPGKRENGKNKWMKKSRK